MAHAVPQVVCQSQLETVDDQQQRTSANADATPIGLYRQSSPVGHPPQLPGCRGVLAQPCEQLGERIGTKGSRWT
jgi:hypothetical protein